MVRRPSLTGMRRTRFPGHRGRVFPRHVPHKGLLLSITVFAWMLADFIILVVKSLVASEWPLRDFLKGCVPCRSVSELVGGHEGGCAAGLGVSGALHDPGG